jgi:hypothetical protein
MRGTRGGLSVYENIIIQTVDALYHGRGRIVLKTALTLFVASHHQRYVTLECYGCIKCGTYPTQPIVFSDIKLAAAGQDVTPRWSANPKPAKDICNEAIAIGGPEKITISFQ